MVALGLGGVLVVLAIGDDADATSGDGSNPVETEPASTLAPVTTSPTTTAPPPTTPASTTSTSTTSTSTTSTTLPFDIGIGGLDAWIGSDPESLSALLTIAGIDHEVVPVEAPKKERGKIVDIETEGSLLDGGTVIISVGAGGGNGNGNGGDGDD